MSNCKLFFESDAGNGLGNYRCFICEKSLMVPTRIGENAARNCPKSPSALERAANFAAAVVKYVASGMADVTQEEFDKRGEICQACPIYDHANESCGKCGCTVGGKERLIDKRRMKSEKCPDGKW